MFDFFIWLTDHMFFFCAKSMVIFSEAKPIGIWGVIKQPRHRIVAIRGIVEDALSLSLSLGCLISVFQCFANLVIDQGRGKGASN